MTEVKQFLSVPPEESVRYSMNYIKTAVCELRFPVLLELEEKPPYKFQSALRKTFPYYSKHQGVAVGQQGVSSAGIKHLFESRKRDWSVGLKPDTLAIETKSYTEFESFCEQLEALIGMVGEFLDTDFYTRVGLRYINSVDIEDGELGGWINPLLISPLLDSSLGLISGYQCELRGELKNGFYMMRHGYDPSKLTDEGRLQSYLLDFDYFAEAVPVSELISTVKEFHDQNFSLFRWCLGEKAKDKLGEGKGK